MKRSRFSEEQIIAILRVAFGIGAFRQRRSGDTGFCGISGEFCCFIGIMVGLCALRNEESLCWVEARIHRVLLRAIAKEVLGDRRRSTVIQ
jgi:hypothetical protein